MKTIGIILGGDPRKHSGGVEKVIGEITKPLIDRYKLIYIFIAKKNLAEIEGNIEYYGIKSRGRSPFNYILFATKLGRFNLDLIIDNIGVARLFRNIPKTTKIIQICHGVVGGAIRDIKVNNRLLKIGYFIYYFFIHILWKITYKRADKVIVAPEGGKELIHRYYGVSKAKIEIIYNGIDFISENIRPFDGTLKIVFISNNHPRRGIHILEKVAKRLEHEKVIFKIIGSTYNNKSIKNIVYLGVLKGKDKYKEIIDSDLVFMPGCYEGQNLSVLEGMSVGCIPLVSKNTNTNNIEGTELEQFTLEKNNADMYINKIRYLLKNENEIDRLKKVSQDIIKDLTRDNQSKLYEKAINDLLY